MNSLPWLRRHALRRMLSLALMAGVAPTLWAADGYPSKTITVIVNGGAGSLPDNFARPLAERLRQVLGQPVVVDNKPGAGGLVALQALKTAPADGHTLAIVTNAHVVWNPFVFPKLTYDPQADLLPVSPIALIPMALVVNPKLPARSVEELVALAKREPGVLNYASSSNGSPPHVLFELFKEQSGSRIVHIPFRTGPDALTSVMAGDTQVYLAGTSLVEPMVKDGRLRVLAVSPSVKSPTFASVPTFADKKYNGFESAVWLGLVTNAGVPATVVERLNREIGQLLQDPAVQKVFESQGSLPYHASPAAFAQRIAQDRALWTPVLQKLDLKPN